MAISFPLEVVCRTPITERMIKFVAAKAASVIQCRPPTATFISGRAISPPPTPLYNDHAGTYERKSETQIPSLPVFISTVIERSRAQTPTLLSTLVYLDRLQRRLPKTAKGMHCTCHRVFLAALILAAKYTNDASPKNRHWARYSCAFSLAEINLMEKQLLFLLDFDLRIHELELIAQSRPFFLQDIVHPSPMIRLPLALFPADHERIQPNRIQPAPEPHHRSLQTISAFPHLRRFSNSPCDQGLQSHRKLQVHHHISCDAERKYHAAFYPSPSHSDTAASVHGGSRRSSTSDPNIFDSSDALANGEGSLTGYGHRNHPNISRIALVDTLESHSYYHGQPHHQSRGVIC